jgi:hypothetical protein
MTYSFGVEERHYLEFSCRLAAVQEILSLIGVPLGAPLGGILGRLLAANMAFTAKIKGLCAAWEFARRSDYPVIPATAHGVPIELCRLSAPRE